jgi:ferredoxin
MQHALYTRTRTRGHVPSPYAVLQVSRDADDEEIMAAYRERVLAVHPDQGGSPEAFQQVREAYQDLMEPGPGEDRRPDGDTSTAATERRAPVGNKAPHYSDVTYLNYEVVDDHGWALDDGDLFAKAADAGLDRADFGEFTVEPGEYLLEAAEAAGLTWPFACRGGACSNCTVKLVEGEIPPPVNHVLPQELIDRGIRLSCITQPVSPEAKIVYNVKHLPGVAELLLPASRFEQARADD